jgi:polyhydroxybutyrate depolymerase
MRRALFRRMGIGIGLVGAAGLALFVSRHRDSRTLVLDGVERTYDVVIEGSPSADPLPLVFIFHGRNGSGWRIRMRAGIDTAAHESGDRAIFVFPQALEYPGTNVLGWQVACDGPDMRFVDAIVEELAERHAIDRRLIFASGFSWGAEMAIALGCCRHEGVRAVAPMSGGTWDNVSDTCREQAPAFRMTIGDADPHLPLGVVQHITDEFRARHGCSARTREAGPNCRVYEDCDAPVIQCVYPGMGHEVPPNGGREIWSFLRSFSARPADGR